MINERMKAWSITQSELKLRWEYATTDMSLAEFNRKFNKLKKQGLVIRNGRPIK